MYGCRAFCNSSENNSIELLFMTLPRFGDEMSCITFGESGPTSPELLEMFVPADPSEPLSFSDRDEFNDAEDAMLVELDLSESNLGASRSTCVRL